MGGLFTKEDKVHNSIDYINTFELFYYRYINDNSLKIHGDMVNEPVLSIHGLFSLLDFFKYVFWGYDRETYENLYTVIDEYNYDKNLTHPKLRKKFIECHCNNYSVYYTKQDVIYILRLLIFEIIHINEEIPNLEHIFNAHCENILKNLVIPESIYNSIRKINNKYINENTNYLILLQSNGNKYTNVNNTIQEHLTKTKSVIENNIKVLSNINERLDNSIMALSIMGKINNTELLNYIKNNQEYIDPIPSAPLIECVTYDKETIYPIPSAQIIENELEVILCDK